MTLNIMLKNISLKKPEDLFKYKIFSLLVEVVNRIVAPESLVIAKKTKVSDDEKQFAMYVANTLMPGDIILVVYM